MIYVDLITIERGGIYCDNYNCKRAPEYTYNIIGKNHHIKVGTVAAKIVLGISGTAEIYCGGCITMVFDQVRSKLDKNLWALL